MRNITPTRGEILLCPPEAEPNRRGAEPPQEECVKRDGVGGDCNRWGDLLTPGGGGNICAVLTEQIWRVPTEVERERGVQVSVPWV